MSALSMSQQLQQTQSVPCKPLCCSPTLLTLPLKIRVPSANATHLYIIILQLLNILASTKYCPIQHSSTMHALLQHSSTMHALLQHSSTMHALLQHSSTTHALLQHSSNYACPATAQFNSRTLLSSSCQPL